MYIALYMHCTRAPATRRRTAQQVRVTCCCMPYVDRYSCIGLHTHTCPPDPHLLIVSRRFYFGRLACLSFWFLFEMLFSSTRTSPCLTPTSRHSHRMQTIHLSCCVLTRGGFLQHHFLTLPTPLSVVLCNTCVPRRVFVFSHLQYSFGAFSSPPLSSLQTVNVAH